MTTAYLIANPPVRDQFRTTRRARPTGCIVVHTAETTADFTPPDSAAENVARFIRTRTTAGSYHDLADSDTVIHLVPYEYEAYGDGTGSNRFATHVSGAVQAGKWATYSKAYADAVVRNMALAASRQAKWVKAKYGINVPAVRITKAQSDAGMAGFIAHGTRDPATRSDPGFGFNWTLFLAEYARLMVLPTPTPAAPKPPSTVPAGANRALTAQIQRWLEIEDDGLWGAGTDARAYNMRAAARTRLGYPGLTPTSHNIRLVQSIIDTTVDGIWGPNSQRALLAWIRTFQSIIGTTPDGIWGPGTESRYQTVRKANFNKF
jgi:hypothetical protein